MKFKLILTYPEDKLKLQRFLNEQSSRGWHLTKQRIFGLQMSYDPEVQYHYEVMFSNAIRTASNGPQDQQKHEDLLEEFGYEAISGTNDFLIYRSENATPLYTDPLITEAEEKLSYRKILLNTLLLPLVVVLNFASLLQIPTISLLVNPITIIAIVAQISLLIFSFYRLRNVWRMKQGKMNNELNYRWNPTKHDPLSIIYLIQIGVLILFILPPMSPITYVFIIFIALGIVLENLSISNLEKYGLMFILMILSVYMMVTVTISPFFKNNDNLPIESEKRLHDSSFLASREILYNGNFEIITVESKVDMMNEFTINALLEEQRISETIPLNSLTEINTAYGMKKYVYRNENKIVISDKKQSDDFYKEFN